MNRIAIVAAAAAMVMSAGAAYAQAGVRLGTPTYGGTGCPAGSAAISLSPDATSLSILFDSFVVEAGSSAGFPPSARKVCGMAIPINIPQGLSVSLVAIDYRGFYDLPAGANANFRVEYFFAGGSGPVFNRTFNGPDTDSYLISNNLVGVSLVWSPCGQDIILRADPSIRVASAVDYAQATVDSSDIATALLFHFQWRTC